MLGVASVATLGQPGRPLVLPGLGYHASSLDVDSIRSSWLRMFTPNQRTRSPIAGTEELFAVVVASKKVKRPGRCAVR